MKRLWGLAGLAALLTLAACATLAKPPPVGDHPPVIKASFASPTIHPGRTWKVFIQAHDPDGDLWEVLFEIKQLGYQYPPHAGDVYLPRRYWAGMDGYFYLPLPYEPLISLQDVDLVLSVTLADRGGRTSETLKFPLSIGTKPAAPDPEGFADEALLAVPIAVRPSSPRASGGIRPLLQIF